MIITCNECNSSFKIGDSLIKATGSKVRCSKCNTVFVAYPQPPDVEDLPETAAARSESGFDEHRLSPEEDLESAVSDVDLADLLSDEDPPAPGHLPAETAAELESNLLASAGEADETAAPGAGTDLGELDLSDFEDLVGLDDELESFDEFEDDLEDSAIALKAEAETLPNIEGTDLEMADKDELDFGDLELEGEEFSPVKGESTLDSEDLQLDLGLDLEAEASDLSQKGVPLAEEAGEDEIDFLNVEHLLERETSPVTETPETAAPDELELDLDLEAETIASGATDESDSATETVDELDFSDLEAIIDADESPASRDAAATASEDLELDLDFQLDDGAETADAGAALDSSDELDLSDLEKMLESGPVPAGQTPTDETTEDLELQFETVEQPSGAADTGVSDHVREDDDFLDIEKMLEASEDTPIAEEPQSAVEDLDLPLEMEALVDETSSASEADLELEFALEREPQETEEFVDSASVADKHLESNLLVPEDVDRIDDEELEALEFQEKMEDRETTDEFATDEFAEIGNMNGQTDVLTAAEDELPSTIFKKTPSRKPLVLVLLLIILAAAMVIIPNSLGIKIPFISALKIPYISDLRIPYLSDLLNTEGQDVAGNLKLIPLSPSIDGKFIDNSTAGKLFVVQGKIKNEYDHPRSFVKVTGKLYQKGQKLVKAATVFCGNVIAESDLAQMDIAAINARLQNSSGDNDSNLKIKTNNEVAFMIVFDELPENLDEYTIEVAGSSI
jgi:pilus assembly protein FimV